MEWLSSIVALVSACGGGLVPLVGVGLLVYLLHANVRRDVRRLDETAAALGLSIAPAKPRGAFTRFLTGDDENLQRRMTGSWGGVPVEAGIRVVITGTGRSQSKSYYTFVRATFPRSLDLGLSVSPEGALERFFGVSDLAVGHPVLDPALRVRSAEPKLSVALLRAPAVEEALVALVHTGFGIHLEDREVRRERRGRLVDPGALAHALDGTVELARRVWSARLLLGASSAERALQASWGPIAAARGLSLDLAAGRMMGRVDGVHVEMGMELRGDQRWTVLTARFDRRLGVSLRLTRQTSLSGVARLLGAQDIVVGDPVFDARFVVKGAPEASVRALLGPEVRARLVQLEESATSLGVADDHLTAELGWLLVEPTWIERALVSVARAAASLQQTPHRELDPYRG